MARATERQLRIYSSPKALFMPASWRRVALGDHRNTGELALADRSLEKKWW